MLRFRVELFESRWLFGHILSPRPLLPSNLQIWSKKLDSSADQLFKKLEDFYLQSFEFIWNTNFAFKFYTRFKHLNFYIKIQVFSSWFIFSCKRIREPLPMQWLVGTSDSHLMWWGRGTPLWQPYTWPASLTGTGDWPMLQSLNPKQTLSARIHFHCTAIHSNDIVSVFFKAFNLECPSCLILRIKICLW